MRSQLGRCPGWYLGLQDMGKELSLKREATGPGTNPGGFLEWATRKVERLGRGRGTWGQGLGITSPQGRLSSLTHAPFPAWRNQGLSTCCFHLLFSANTLRTCHSLPPWHWHKLFPG